MSLSWLLLIPLLTFVVLKYKSFLKTGTPLPPGPPADPLIGHIRSIPSYGQDVYFYKLGLKYGDVVYLNIFGQSTIILNSVQAATELFDKRGANYSDRPDFPIFELLGWGAFVAFLKYGTEWRKQRAMIQHYLSKEKSKEYRPILIREARALAQGLLSEPEDKFKLFLRFSTAVIIDVNYGHQVTSTDDPYLKILDDCSHVAMNIGPPGRTPVDLFPFLRNFPSWFPGTHYATAARSHAHTCRLLSEYPYAEIRKKMGKEGVRPSVLASMIEEMDGRGPENKTDVERMQAITAALYMAGADTTSSTLVFFLLAMLLYPEVQKKGQEEVDRVIGAGRLLEFQDRDKLPYVECILQETLRWHQAIPTGLPHKSMEDDIYNGMFIPKGSFVLANARGIMLDESVYHDPFKFDPARFLPPPQGRGEPYPVGQFGFGRRICPGRHMAEEAVWIVIATMLTTTKMLRAIADDGKEIMPQESALLTGIAGHAGRFPCDLKPRRKDSLGLLQQLEYTESN